MTKITRIQPVISTTGIRRILDNQGREVAEIKNLLDGIDNAERAKESEYIHNEICDRFNRVTTLEARIKELEAAVNIAEEFHAEIMHLFGVDNPTPNFTKANKIWEKFCGVTK